MGRASTKDKILSTAVAVFAELGYTDATVAIICKRAKVNIAAVSYHFGSKESLFLESVRYAFTLANASYPLSKTSLKSAEEKLRHFIESVIRRCFDPGPAGRIDQMLGHEIVRENGPHHLIVQEVQSQQGNVLRKILQAMLKTRSKRLINQAHVNIAALCFFPKAAVPLRKLLFPKPPTEEQLSKYIAGQIDFALAGLQALRPTLSTAK